MDLGEVVWDGVDWIFLAYDRDRWRAVVNAVSIKCWESIEWFHNRWPLEYSAP
jgi:hypothetical protein